MPTRWTRAGNLSTRARASRQRPYSNRQLNHLKSTTFRCLLNCVLSNMTSPSKGPFEMTQFQGAEKAAMEQLGTTLKIGCLWQTKTAPGLHQVEVDISASGPGEAATIEEEVEVTVTTIKATQDTWEIGMLVWASTRDKARRRKWAKAKKDRRGTKKSKSGWKRESQDEEAKSKCSRD